MCADSLKQTHGFHHEDMGIVLLRDFGKSMGMTDLGIPFDKIIKHINANQKW